MALPMLSWATSGTAEQGDFNPGNGITTANKTVRGSVAADSGAIAGVKVGPDAGANHAPAFWIALVVLYFVASYFFKKGEGDSWGFWSITDTTVKAIIGLSVLHWLASYYTVPGLSDVILSA